MTNSYLRKWNIGAAVLHLCVALFFAIILGLKYDSKVVAIDTATYQITERVNLVEPAPVRVRVPQQIAPHLPYLIYSLVIAFPCITAGFHVHAAYSKTYQNWLDRQINPGRWMEYAISSSIMLVIVGISTGVKEFWSVMSLVVSNIALMFCGYCTDMFLASNQRKQAVIAQVLGFGLLVYIWALIISAFLGTLNGLNNESSPDFKLILYILVTVLGFLYLLFWVPQLLQILRPKWCTSPNSENFYRKYVEKGYIVLSFVAKVLLVFLMGWGLYGRNKSQQNLNSDQ